MKKTVCLIIAVLTALMMLSTVTALPVATSQPAAEIVRKTDKINQMILDYNLYTIKSEIKRTLDNTDDLEQNTQGTNFTMTERLRQKSIEMLGVEKYEEVRGMIKNKFSVIERKLATSGLIDSLLIWYELLLELTIFIFAISFLLCGHNIIGDLLGLTIFLIFMPIPIFCLEFIEACLLLPLMVTSVMLGEPVDIEQLLYEWGVLGIALAICVVIPLCILVGIIAVPILSVVFTIDAMFYLLVEGWMMANER